VSIGTAGSRDEDAKSELPRFGVSVIDEMFENLQHNIPPILYLKGIDKSSYYPLFLIMTDRFAQYVTWYGLPNDKYVLIRYAFVDLGIKKPRLTVSVVRDFSPTGYAMLDTAELKVEQSGRDLSVFIPTFSMHDTLGNACPGCNKAMIKLGATRTGHVAYINTNKRLVAIPRKLFGQWFYTYAIPRKYSPLTALISSVAYLIGDVLVVITHEDTINDRSHYILIDIAKAAQPNNKPYVKEGPNANMWVKSVLPPNHEYLKEILNPYILEPERLILWLNNNNVPSPP